MCKISTLSPFNPYPGLTATVLPPDDPSPAVKGDWEKVRRSLGWNENKFHKRAKLTTMPIWSKRNYTQPSRCTAVTANRKVQSIRTGRSASHSRDGEKQEEMEKVRQREPQPLQTALFTISMTFVAWNTPEASLRKLPQLLLHPA